MGIAILQSWNGILFLWSKGDMTFSWIAEGGIHDREICGLPEAMSFWVGLNVLEQCHQCTCWYWTKTKRQPRLEKLDWILFHLLCCCPIAYARWIGGINIHWHLLVCIIFGWVGSSTSCYICAGRLSYWFSQVSFKCWPVLPLYDWVRGSSYLFLGMEHPGPYGDISLHYQYLIKLLFAKSLVTHFYFSAPSYNFKVNCLAHWHHLLWCLASSTPDLSVDEMVFQVSAQSLGYFFTTI